MNRAQAEELVKKYNAGTASAQEINMLENWYVQEFALQEVDLPEKDFIGINRKMWQNIQQRRNQKKTKALWPRIAAAACVLLCLGLGIFYYQSQQDFVHQKEELASNDIAPGKNSATLTLADGKKIVLTDKNNGTIASQAGEAIMKTADGKLIYQSDGNNRSGELVFNNLVTARGEQYQLILSDGTRVWLNAESSLKFPASFNGQSSRSVELTGQAYFEVSKDKKHPFVVMADRQKLEVLGTHFDISSYPGEAVRTTLLEGSVKIATMDKIWEKPISQKILKPGQQSVLNKDTEILQVYDVDAEYAVAWKNGFFQFDNADIKTVMHQLSRWYDIEVGFSGAIPQERFSGKVYRNMSLSKVLDVLSLSQINFEIKGRKMTIYPNKNK